jgi:hypothetical protein
MNKNFERNSRGQLEAVLQNLPQGMRENHGELRTADAKAEIRTEYL